MAIYIESLTVESSTGLRGLEVLFGFMSAKVSKIKIKNSIKDRHLRISSA